MLSLFEYLKFGGFLFEKKREIFVLAKIQSPVRKLNVVKTSLPITSSINKNLGQASRTALGHCLQILNPFNMLKKKKKKFFNKITQLQALDLIMIEL